MQNSSHLKQPANHHLPLLSKIAIARPTDGATMKSLAAKVIANAILAGITVTLPQIAGKPSVSIVARKAT